MFLYKYFYFFFFLLGKKDFGERKVREGASRLLLLLPAVGCARSILMMAHYLFFFLIIFYTCSRVLVHLFFFLERETLYINS